MKYHDPSSVVSPKDFVKNIKVLYDGKQDKFSLAELEWEGGKSFAIRWNIAIREWDDNDKKRGEKVCIGMPSSRGYPVWFVLPPEFDDYVLDLLKKI